MEADAHRVLTNDDVLEAIREVQENDFRAAEKAFAGEATRAEQRERIIALEPILERFLGTMGAADNFGLQHQPRTERGSPPPGGSLWKRLTHRPDIVPALDFWPLALHRGESDWPGSDKVIAFTTAGEWWNGSVSRSGLEESYSLYEPYRLTDVSMFPVFDSIDHTKRGVIFDVAVVFSIAEHITQAQFQEDG